jgi:RimJ/RimL family protein N-acetyltransferase
VGQGLDHVTVRLRRDGVLLRPFRDDEVDVLVRIQDGWSPDDGVHGGEPLSREQLSSRVASSGTWADGPVGLLLAIEADGRLVGELQARGNRSQLLPPHVFELGIEVYERGDRGRGTGRVALAEIARYLFDEEHANRVQLSTDVGNGAMCRAAEAAGFRFEGVMRGFWPMRDGEPHDYALYGRTRADHTADGRGDG